MTAANFRALRISLASPEKIREWSHGEVKKPETINYRTFKPERDGLFCERIFGPSKDWECHCGKYKKVKYKGIICDRCGVEVTRAKVRRRRMGHIELAAPVCHIWYLKGVPSPIGLLLDLPTKALEKVIYFASYIVTHVDTKLIHENEAEISTVIQEYIEEEREAFEQWKNDQWAALEERIKKFEEAGEEGEEEEPSALALALGEVEEEEEFAIPAEFDPEKARRELEAQIKDETEALEERIQEIEQSRKMLFELEKKQLISEMEYRGLRRITEVLAEKLSEEFRDCFRAGLGAQAIKELLEEIDLEELSRQLRKEIEETTSGPKRARAIKRLAMVDGFRRSRNRPEWMILEAIPVLPPELRPMVQLDGGRFATSDVNDLYRRIINRNNRLRRIIEIRAPESIINHEKRLLQEAVDALIDNSRRAHPVCGSNRRPLKSLSDLLKGKEGRFRKNLLGKRVDYSGRSVIVVGPELQLHQCGLPREMALELFKPFVMKKLVERNYTTNIKTAKRMVDRLRPEVWDALEEVIEDHPVLLNRAPTLHRLGIQAFEPVLVDGKAIQIHPLVCHAFNADFDGDQMAVHVPLSAYAQAEARVLMLSTRNLFKPADGKPTVAPVYEIVLGCYYMTQLSRGSTGEPADRYFASEEEAITAYAHRVWDLHSPAWIRLDRLEVKGDLDPVDHAKLLERIEVLCAQAYERADAEKGPKFRVGDPPIKFTAKQAAAAVEELEAAGEAQAQEEGAEEQPAEPEMDPYDELRYQIFREVAAALHAGELKASAKIEIELKRERVATTIGRTIFNSVVPLDLRDYDKVYDRGALAELVSATCKRHGVKRLVRLLDDLKRLGFHYATQSGVSIAATDMEIETGRDKIIEETEEKVRRLNEQFQIGLVTAGEREDLVRRHWMQASEQVVANIIESIDKFNPIYMMVDSGSRGNPRQISQLAGMRGLMADPFGRLIEDLPVKSNFREGLKVLEYFVSTHGARKGLADTALRTADAGYLTRRLVDVAQDVIIKEEDCGTTNGIDMTPIYSEDVVCRKCSEPDFHREGDPPYYCKHCGAELPTTDATLVIPLQERIIGRFAAEPVVDPNTGKILVDANEEITPELAEKIVECGIRRVRIRSPLTCETRRGVCVMCYGRDLATWKMVEVGEAIGIIAAQSIGEPGTQLTMRTFHTGGVAAQYLTGVADVKKKKQEALRQLREDIERGIVKLDASGHDRESMKAIQQLLKVLEDPVAGLLRVVELFEARRPKGQAIVSELDGVVAAIDETGLRRVIIHSEVPVGDGNELRREVLAEKVVDPKTKEVIARAGEELNEKLLRRIRKAKIKKVKIQRSYLVPYRGYLRVEPGMRVRAGDRLTEGPLDPQEVLRMRGPSGVQDYLVREIQRVYRAQDVTINDKHIEVIVRQMLKKRRVIDQGDTDLLPGQIVDRFVFEEENRRVQELGGKPAQAEWMLLGITEASLQTESFLSAASFQKTTKVLTEAATRGRVDRLRGLKENVIIGRLIPAGSGLATYRETQVAAVEEEPERPEVEGIEVAFEEVPEEEEAEELLEEEEEEDLAKALELESEGAEEPALETETELAEDGVDDEIVGEELLLEETEDEVEEEEEEEEDEGEE